MQTVSAILGLMAAATFLSGMATAGIPPSPNRYSSCYFNPGMCSNTLLYSPGSTCCTTGVGIGYCVNTSIDVLNCGGCGKTCSFGKFCCNGACVNLLLDSYNCGRCGLICKKGSGYYNGGSQSAIGVCKYGMCEYNSY